MQKFNYNLDYINIFFQPNDYRYRIGEKEQGVFLVRPYSDDIGKFWKFSTEKVAEESSEEIYKLYLSYKEIQDFVGMDMCRKYLSLGYSSSKYSSFKTRSDQICEDEFYIECYNRHGMFEDALVMREEMLVMRDRLAKGMF